MAPDGLPIYWKQKGLFTVHLCLIHACYHNVPLSCCWQAVSICEKEEREYSSRPILSGHNEVNGENEREKEENSIACQWQQVPPQLSNLDDNWLSPIAHQFMPTAPKCVWFVHIWRSRVRGRHYSGFCLTSGQCFVSIWNIIPSTHRSECLFVSRWQWVRTRVFRV